MAQARSRIRSRSVITVLTFLGLAVLPGGPFAGEAAAQPSIRFATELHSAVEAHADLAIPMILSEPAPSFLEIEIQQVPITATPDMDYIGGSIWAYVQPGESMAEASPHLFGDMAPEPPEKFRLEILDGGGLYTIGSVGTCRVTIVDGDSESLSAHFEIEEDVR